MERVDRTTDGWRSGSGSQLGTDLDSSPTPAVRGTRPGRRAWTGAVNGTGSTKLLGWFSIGLGVMQVVAPREVTRLIGVRPGRRSTAVMRTMGLREIAHGVSILRQPRSKEWVSARVGGDLLDIALLGVALTQSERPERTLLATASVLGVTGLDVRAAQQLAEERKAPSPDVLEEPGAFVTRSVTVGRPVADVYAFWRDFANLPRFMKHLESVDVTSAGRSRWRASGPAGVKAEWEAELLEDQPNERISWRSIGSPDVYNEGTVRFRSAPADRGTVVTVEMRYAPPGGRIGAAILKLFRQEPGQQVGDDLRRFKQVMETGEVLLSDATAVEGAHEAQPARPGERQ